MDGNLSFFIAEHWPSVDPSAGHEQRHAADGATVLEDDAIPVAPLRVDDGSLSRVAESAEGSLENNILLIRSFGFVGTIAHFAAMAAWCIDLRNHQQVVATLKLDHTRTLQQASLLSFALEGMAVRVRHHTLQVGSQLHLLACTIEHINAAVVVEEQRCIVEVRQSRHQCPRSFCFLSRIDIGAAHVARLVRHEEHIEATVVVFQRGCPLSAPVDGAFEQAVAWRVIECLTYIAGNLPVDEIL